MGTDSDATVCPDWVWLNNCNVHVAKDRGWFKTYTPFASTINHSIFTSPGQLPVLGIGTVEIPTKRSPNRSGVSSHGSLRLKQVLHVPDFLCNIIGYSIIDSDGYDVVTSFSPSSCGTIKDRQGKNIAYFDPKRPLFSVKVRNHPDGPKLGPFALKKSGLYMLSCEWDSIEQLRWIQYQAQNGLNSRGLESAHAADENPLYTDAEKAFLKRSWGDEYHFLLAHGLKIHKDEDRVEGRAILRVLMRDDAFDDDHLERVFSDEHSSDADFDDDEHNFMGHQADYNFSANQLGWIEEHYGNSENFMCSYGLKFYDDDDVEEAKAIADVMMSEDD